MDWLGLTEATLPLWLSAPEPDQSAPTPRWALFLREVLAGDDFLNRDSEIVSRLTNPLPAVPWFPILAEPFVAIVERRIAERLPQYHRMLTATARGDIASHVAQAWSNLAARTLAKEIRQSSRLGRLQGTTSAERYERFMEQFRASPESYWSLYRRFPVLARLQATRCQQIIDHISELLARLSADEGEIERFLGGAMASDSIRHLHLGLSDPHAGGRSVVRIEFESHRALLYKPRSLRLDVKFAELLAWWNRRHPELTLRAARVLDRGDYGWAESVLTRECRNLQEVSEYFRRQGAFAALFYLLGAMDFHYDNFVPAGDTPVPIDLEVLLNPRRHSEIGFNALRSSTFPSASDTCLETGMLPAWHASDDDHISHLVSGIGGTGKRGIPAPRIIWKKLGTDELQLSRTDVAVEDHHESLPRLDSQPVLPGPYIPAIADGFERMYREIARNRGELLSDDGPLNDFCNANIRVLARSTREYIDLLSLSTAPDYLISGAAYDLALELLCVKPIPFEMDFRIVDSEKRSMWNRDVPMFVTTAGSVHLHDSAGVDLGPVFDISSCDFIVRRLQAAGESDLNWQLQVLQASLRMACDDTYPIGLAFSGHSDHARSENDPLLDAAVNIGEALERLALQSPRGATWLSLRPASTFPNIDFYRIDPWVYDGAAGVAVFLANLHEVTKSDAFSRLAIEAARFAIALAAEEYSESSPSDINFSSFSGRPSLAFALLECGRRLQRDDLLEQGWSILRQLLQGAQGECENPDLMGGVAGLISVLLRFHQEAPHDWLLDEAVRLAELLHRWPRDVRNIGGFRVPWNDRPLTGMAHGQAGIALALIRLTKVTDLPWCRPLIDDLLQYEASQFADDLQDWLDLRVEEPGIMPSWCAGAPGIGMSRLGLIRHGHKNSMVEESLNLALASVTRHLGDPQQSLCCGESGRLWFLSEAGAQLGRADLAAQARAAASTMIEKAAERGFWQLVVREPNTLPGLMSGISGIGLSLLQVRDPGSVTRILTLE